MFPGPITLLLQDIQNEQQFLQEIRKDQFIVAMLSNLDSWSFFLDMFFKIHYVLSSS